MRGLSRLRRGADGERPRSARGTGRGAGRQRLLSGRNQLQHPIFRGLLPQKDKKSFWQSDLSSAHPLLGYIFALTPSSHQSLHFSPKAGVGVALRSPRTTFHPLLGSGCLLHFMAKILTPSYLIFPSTKETVLSPQNCLRSKRWFSLRRELL